MLSRWFPLSLFFKLPVPQLIIRRYLLGQEIEDAIIILFKKSLNTVNNNVLAFRVREIANLKIASGVVGLRCVYIQAGDDRLVPATNVAVFNELVTDITVVNVPGPHFILQAQPAECAKIIENEFYHRA